MVNSENLILSLICVGVLAIGLGVAFVVLYYIIGRKRRASQRAISSVRITEGKLEPARTENQAKELPYRLRDNFLSPAEFSFYKVLSFTIGEEYTIQSKVRLADIFYVARPNENSAFRYQINQKHVDFLVCDAQKMKPLFGIELDDSSHQLSNRKERDEFVQTVFDAAHLPLVRFPAQREYNSREIAAQIEFSTKVVLNLSNLPAAQSELVQAGSAPLCPKCGIPMVIRIAQQGENIGSKFYGCRNFPQCRITRPIQTYGSGEEHKP